MNKLSLSTKFANMSFICAMLVVAIHVPRSDFGLAWWLNRFVMNGVCCVAVPFFSVASGYFLSKHFDEAGWWRRELQKRIDSLVVPFLIWNILFVGLMVMSRSLGNELDSPKVTLHVIANWLGLNPFRIPANGPLWFIRSLLFCVVLSPMLRRLANKVGLVVLFGLYVAICPDWSSGKDLFRYGLLQGPISLFGIFYFTVGIYLRQKSCAERGGRLTLFLLLVSGALILVMRCLAECNGIDGWCWLVPIYTALLLPVVWQMCPSRSFGWIVRYAFPIYLIHYFFTTSSLNAPIKWMVRNWGGLGEIAGVFWATGLSLVIAVMLCRFRKLNQWCYGNRTIQNYVRADKECK